MRKVCVALLLMVGGPWVPRAAAHDVDVTSVARVFLEQLGPARYLLSVVDRQVPPMGGRQGMLPAHCSPVASDQISTRMIRGLVFECERELSFDDVITLRWPLEGVVVVGTWSNGVRASGFFKGNGAAVRIRLGDLSAGPGSLARLGGRYLSLGVEHILSGIDHLLFVAGLLLLVSGTWPLVKTVTAFTIAHSVTLGAAVAGWVPVEAGPVEAAIALSIVLLAREIVMGYRGRVHLVHRRPWLVAFVFGLLHGLGFAGALREIGLPGGDIPQALLFFNLGVEGGQLAFVAGLLALRHVSQRLQVFPPRHLRPALGYALGTVATLWVLDRLPAVWGA